MLSIRNHLSNNDNNDKKDLFGAAERMTAELEKRIKNKFSGLNG
jgi:hypothetical protein